MEKKNYADVLESYKILSPVGIITRLLGTKKNIAQKKSQETDYYKEYFKFLDTVLEKIPSTEIAKEKALRKKEWSTVASISKSGVDIVGYELEDFLNCSNFLIFENYVFELRSFYCYDELRRTHSAEEINRMSEREYANFLADYSNRIESACEKMCKLINSKNLKCFEDPETDWDKDEGMLVISAKPSAAFMEIAREFGYVSYETYVKNR